MAERILTPGGQAGATYDSNIDFSEGGKSDLIFFVNPNILFKLSGKSGLINFEYGFIYYDYLNTPDLNYYSHLLESKLQFTFLKEFTFNISYSYSLLPMNLGYPKESPNNLVITSNLQSDLKYKHDFSPRTSIETGIEGSIMNYDGITSDYRGGGAPVIITQKLNRLISAGVGYKFMFRDYISPELLDYLVNQAAIHGRFKFKRAELSLKAGYQRLDFENGAENSAPLLGIEGNYNPNNRSTIKIAYDYTYTNDARGTPFIGQNGKLDIGHKLTKRLDFSMLYNLYNYRLTSYNYKFLSNELIAEISYRASRYIYFTLEYSYNNILSEGSFDGVVDRSLINIHRGTFISKIKF